MGSALKYVDRLCVAADTGFTESLGPLGSGSSKVREPTPLRDEALPAALPAATALPTRSRALRDWRWRFGGGTRTPSERRKEEGDTFFFFRAEEDLRLIPERKAPPLLFFPLRPPPPVSSRRARVSLSLVLLSLPF